MPAKSKWSQERDASMPLVNMAYDERGRYTERLTQHSRKMCQQVLFGGPLTTQKNVPIGEGFVAWILRERV